MHALLHSGRRGARGFGLRAASLRGLPLEGPAVPRPALASPAVSGGVKAPAGAVTLSAALDRAERAGLLTFRIQAVAQDAGLRLPVKGTHERS